MTARFIEYDRSTGRIMRRGKCDSRFVPAPKPGRSVVEMWADPRKCKIEDDGLDVFGDPITPRQVPLDG